MPERKQIHPSSNIMQQHPRNVTDVSRHLSQVNHSPGIMYGVAFPQGPAVWFHTREGFSLVHSEMLRYLIDCLDSTFVLVEVSEGAPVL